MSMGGDMLLVSKCFFFVYREGTKKGGGGKALISFLFPPYGGFTSSCEITIISTVHLQTGLNGRHSFCPFDQDTLWYQA